MYFIEKKHYFVYFFKKSYILNILINKIEFLLITYIFLSIFDSF